MKLVFTSSELKPTNFYLEIYSNYEKRKLDFKTNNLERFYDSDKKEFAYIKKYPIEGEKYVLRWDFV